MISADLLLHTATPSGGEAFTFLCTYERFIHAEVMTHRWSRNASSSRAVPLKKMIEWIDECPAMPIHMGSNKSGMQSGPLVDDPSGAEYDLRKLYEGVRNEIVRLNERYGLHKEILNRYLEPWGWITSVMTMGRDQLMNYLSLRLDAGATPNIQRLAVRMGRQVLDSTPLLLQNGDWHIPFYDYEQGIPRGTLKNARLLDALKWSVARCAWTSYNSPNKATTDEAATRRWRGCIDDLHVSPCEHQLRAVSGTGRGVVPGYTSYRMMLPRESVAEFNLAERLEAYADRDYLISDLHK